MRLQAAAKAHGKRKADAARAAAAKDDVAARAKCASACEEHAEAVALQLTDASGAPPWQRRSGARGTWQRMREKVLGILAVLYVGKMGLSSPVSFSC